jgi:hypothetical protein
MLVRRHSWRRKEDNMKENILYVLGAGASIGGKFNADNDWIGNMRIPSGSNFLFDSFRQFNNDGSIRRYLNILGLTYEGLNRFISTAYRINKDGFDPKEWKKINIEDVLTFLDIGESMYVENSKYKKAFCKLKHSLVDYIAMQIMITSSDKKCELLDVLFSDLGKNDSVFTFNYDLVAERSLLINDSIQYHNYVDFMKTHRNKKAILQKGIFLKLHGSIDWGMCENPKCELYEIPYLFTDIINCRKLNAILPKCDKCKKQLVAAIIPPLSNKVKIESDELFHKQWVIAKNQIIKYRHIVFYGYSFPKTDYYSDWLFRHVNLSIDEKGKEVVHRIDVINPEMTRKRSATYKRYYELFRSHDIRIYESLEKYLESR